MNELLEEYENHLRAKEIRTYEAYLVTINEFLTFVEEDKKEALYLPEGFGDEYRSYLLHREPPLNRKTINNKLNRVKGFYRFLLKRGKVLFDPFEETEGLKGGVNLPKNILGVEDMGTLLENFAVRKEQDWMYLAFCELLYGSALRISEVEGLKMEDVDYPSRTLSIWERKTQKERTVPATETALRRLKYYCDKVRPGLLTSEEFFEGFLFPQRGGTTIRCSLNRRLKAECRRLHLPPLSSHSFRHCAATHMLKAGAGIREVQAFLGHSRIASTQVYTRIVTEDLKALVTGFHPREVKP